MNAFESSPPIPVPSNPSTTNHVTIHPIKRLRRILFNALTVISLLLALATAGLWVRSVHKEVELTAPLPQGIRDRDKKFTSGFDMLFKSIGIATLKLLPRSPNLNAFAERFVRSIKEECIERMIFFGEPMLRHAVTHYIEHYHVERPHQGLSNVIPFPSETEPDKPRDGSIECRERLGGLLKHYHRKAAA